MFKILEFQFLLLLFYGSRFLSSIPPIPCHFNITPISHGYIAIPLNAQLYTQFDNIFAKCAFDGDHICIKCAFPGYRIPDESSLSNGDLMA